MSEESRREGSPAGQSRAETLVDDVFGVDFKVGRTVRDLVIRPGRVADAAMASDHSSYTRPMRLFLALVAVQTLLFGWAGVTDAYSLSITFADNPNALAAVEARLAAAGSSLAEADGVLAKWASWSTWPVVIVSSLLYVLAIWAMRPSLGLFKTFMLYLTGTNAGSILTLPLLFGAIFFGAAGLMTASAGSFIVLFFYFGLVLHRRSADTALGLAMRIVVLVLTTLPLMLVVSLLQLGALELGLRLETGVSWLQLIAASQGVAPS